MSLSGNMGHVITTREPGQVTTKVLVAIMPVVGRQLYSLVRYLVSKGVNVPEFIFNKHCPWETREDFVKAKNSPQMIELRNLLFSTIPLQTEFILLRLENALPKMVSAISIKNRSKVQSNFYKLIGS